MWGWFGGSAAQKRRDAPKNAILKLREQMDMLNKREKHLQNQMAEQEEIARKNVTTNKAAAKAALRRKKLHERTLEQTSAQIAQVEQQIYTIEAANINQETLSAMQNAGKAIKQIHGNLTIDKVDEIMDELREQHALGEEISNAITSAPLGTTSEADVEEELEALEQEAMDERMLHTGPTPVDRLPGVKVANEPIKGKAAAVSSTATQEEEDEEAELRKLQAEMAM